LEEELKTSEIILADLLSLLYQHLWLMAGFILAVLLFASIFENQRQSSTSLAWILAIILIPYIAIPLYIIFGGRKLRYLTKNKKPIYSQECSLQLPSNASQGAKLLCSHSLPPPRAGNEMRLLQDGISAYEELMRLIDSAEQSIDIEMFILAKDGIGRSIVDRLSERAREGIKIRLMVDALGSLYTRFGMLRKLKQSGVEVAVFMRLIPIRRRRSANLRNHRKLVIIDGHTALTGGMNLGNDYMGPEADKKRWIDTLTLLKGPAVADLIDVFDGDWQFAVDQEIERTPTKAPIASGDRSAQIIPSGPDIYGDPLYDLLLSSIYNAEKRIWICTPYFIPDQGMARALKIAELAGVDVKLIMPRHSNHRIADQARNRLLRELQRYDAEIYLHSQMIHAKHILIDDHFALTGSANIDMRSLYLNYELSLLSDSAETIEEVEQWMRNLMGECQRENVLKHSRLRRWIEDICWLLSPLL
jgi:cardiolipin synthase A/B